MKADPPGDPVAQDRPQNRAQPRRKQPDMARTHHAAERYQQDRSRDDEGNADKAFRQGDDKGDGKAPIGMRLRRQDHKAAGVVDEPVENAEKHAFACCFFRAGFRTGRRHTLPSGLAPVAGTLPTNFFRPGQLYQRPPVAGYKVHAAFTLAVLSHLIY